MQDCARQFAGAIVEPRGRADGRSEAEGAKQEPGVTGSRKSSRATGVDRCLVLVSVKSKRCRLNNSAIFEQQRVLQ